MLRSDLASVAGMATETLIRTLSAFKKEGLIAINDREIGILDSGKTKKNSRLVFLEHISIYFRQELLELILIITFKVLS